MELSLDIIKEFLGEGKFVKIHKTNENTIVIGQISEFMIDGTIHYYEYHNNQISDYFTNCRKKYILEKNDYVELLTEDDVKEFHNRLNNSNLYYENYYIHLKDKELQFNCEDYIQSKAETETYSKITKVRFPVDITEPIMYEYKSIRSADIDYYSITSQLGIETEFNKIEKIPDDFYLPFERVLYANEDTQGYISCGFYNQKYSIIDNNYPFEKNYIPKKHSIIGSKEPVDFCLPYNFETKEYIGKHMSKIKLPEFYSK
jgi:hypothetical protein